MKRTVAVVGVLGLTLGLGAGAATAQTVTEPETGVSTGSMVIDTIERAATEEDAAGAIQTAVGEMTVAGLRECGVGALIGTTTDEFTVKNVATFLSVAGKRMAAIASGPAAVVSTLAGGCVERALLNAYGVNSGSSKAGGSVASLALGGLLGTGLLATASSDSGSSDLLVDAASSDGGSSDTASATASADTGSSELLDSGSLDSSFAVSDALFAGSAGA